MDLFILRHAIAEDKGGFGSRPDSDRPLTEKGARKMRRVAKVLRKMGLSFDLILSSPFRRAKETAEIVADEFDCLDVLMLSSHLSVGGDPALFIREINLEHKNAGSILLVGHEPYLSGLISILVSGQPDLSITMKKGGICKLTVDKLSLKRCAILEWLMPPAQILGEE